MGNDLPYPNKKGSRRKVAFIIICAMCLTLSAIIYAAVYLLFPRAIMPVHLTEQEEQILDMKIEALTSEVPQTGAKSVKQRSQLQSEDNAGEALEPERYQETSVGREILLTERELNGLLAKNTDMADKLAIDLSTDLVSAKLLVPLDPEFPVFGGKTLKVTAGMELSYGQGRPAAILRGVSIWGVPIPSAWLGDIKNIDLFREFGIKEGFWHTLAEGIADVRITDGKLTIKLKP